MIGVLMTKIFGRPVPVGQSPPKAPRGQTTMPLGKDAEADCLAGHQANSGSCGG